MPQKTTAVKFAKADDLYSEILAVQNVLSIQQCLEHLEPLYLHKPVRRFFEGSIARANIYVGCFV